MLKANNPTVIKPAKDIIISLTTYPPRIKTVEQTIKTLLNQTCEYKKILLILKNNDFPNREKDLPDNLRKLAGDKFEFLWVSEDLRSYSKLIPTLHEYPEDIIVTVDDDMLYEKDWLEKLYKAYTKNPAMIHAHRAHRITFENKKTIKPYKKWDLNIQNVKPSFNNFLTGCGGVLYPPHVLYKDIFNKDLFEKLAPTADDIWFWAMAVLNDTKINVIKGNQSSLNFVEGSQETGLCYTNVANNQNDIQLQNVLNYYPEIYKKLDKRSIEEAHYGLFGRIFSITDYRVKNKHKIITIFGIKIKLKLKKNMQ